ncbi:MAG: GAF domain-containing protein [Melioribacteraceae bacterium]|nr:GAF domain-containing protein [Melioribacteraceae bacterium]
MNESSTKIKKKKSDNNLEVQLAQKDAELKIISSVGEAMSNQLDINTVTKIVGDKIRDIFEAEVTEILLLNYQTEMIEIPYSYYNGYRIFEAFKLGEGLTSKVINSRKPLLLNTLQEQIDLGAIIQSDDDKTESYMGIPILFGEKVLGVVSVQSYQKNIFTDDNVKLLMTLSTYMGTALQNAKLFDETNRLLKETEQRTAELTIINSVGEAMSKQLDVSTVTKIVGDKIKEIFKAEVTEILLLDHKSEMISVPYSYFKGYQKVDPFRLGTGLTSEVITSRKPLLLSNFEDQEKHGAIIDEGIGEADITETYLGVPILFNDQILGVVSIQSYDKNAYDENNVRLLTTLSTNMGVTLENAKLFEETKRLLSETEQRNTELGVINSVQEGLVKQVDLQSIYDLVGEQIHDIFDAQVVGIASFNHDKKTEIFNYVIEKGTRYYPEERNYDKVREYLIKNKKLILINENYLQAAKKYGMKVVEGTEMPKSLLFVPLIVGENVNGYITLQNIDKENAFSESDVRLLTTLANSMSVALENARLFDETNKLLEETKQQAIELKIINSVGDGLAKQLDFQSIIDLVGEKIREVFNAQVVSISTYDKEANLIHHRYAVELDKRYYFDKPQEIDSDRKEIIESKQPLIFGTAQEAIAHSGDDVVAGEMPESFMGVPILRNQEATGVITVQDIDKQNLYSKKDVRLLMTLASNMGVALENARLFEETKRLLNETQQRNIELLILNAIQEGLVEAMEFESIINLVGDKLREALGFKDVGIRVYDKEKNVLHYLYEYEHGVRLKFESGPPTVYSKYVLEKGEMLLLKKNTDEEAAKLGIHGQLTMPGTDRSKSVIMVPIMLGNQAKGLILIEDYEKEDAFSDSEIRLLTTIANSMSVALENARLFDETTRLLKETEQRSAELSVINSVQEGLAKELDLQGIYELVGDRLCTLFPDSQTLVIRSFDHENLLEHWHYAIEKGERLEVEPRPFNWANKLLIETKNPLDIRENYIETAQKYGGKGVTKGKPPKSAVFVPIIINDIVRGSISLQNVDKENAFNDSDVRIVSTLVNSMSVALENARLFDETLRLLDESKKRTDELSTVNSISQAIVGHLEINKLINLVGDKVRDLFKANIVYLALLDKKTEIIEFPYGYGDEYPPLKLGEGLTSKIILTKQPLLLNRKTDEREEIIIGTPSSSYLGVPIPVGNEIIGVLSVQSTERENLFTEDDKRLLITIASHVGIAINNANAYEELNRTLENLQATQNQLIAQEKLASLGQLTAGIAHEIKNPLNFVNNFSELSVGLVEELNEEFENVKDKLGEESFTELNEILATLKQNSEKIKEHGKRADSIVHSMLQHSRGKTGEKQPTDINALLDEDLNLVYHGMRAQDSTFNIKIEREYDANIGDVKIIPQDMSRVFLNILTNGCYEAHRRKVETNSDEPAKIKVTTSADDKFVEVRIHDNGFGIPEKIRENLFTPFFTTKPTGKGTGLGLSISYDIVVREHQGELLFETEEGNFTEFIIRIPKNPK